MSSVLDKILIGVRKDLALRKVQVSQASLEAQIAASGSLADSLAALRTPGLSVIAEVKRASPSQGQMAQIADPAALASSYAANGAVAISVLTEKHYFNGQLDDIDQVRQVVDLPILRKDFVIDRYQLLEGRAHQAQLCLLIVAALDDKQLADLYGFALQLGLTPLVENHTETEVKRAVDLGAELIGVNNRNLNTLQVDLAQFTKLARHIPDSAIKVAESGIKTVADAVAMKNCGAAAVLVGSSLVKNENPGAAIAQMLGAANGNG